MRVPRRQTLGELGGVACGRACLGRRSTNEVTARRMIGLPTKPIWTSCRLRLGRHAHEHVSDAASCPLTLRVVGPATRPVVEPSCGEHMDW